MRPSFANSKFRRHPRARHGASAIHPPSGHSVHLLPPEPTHLDLVAKTLDAPHSTDVGKLAFLEGKMGFLGSFWHPAQNTLLGAFVPTRFQSGIHSHFSSENDSLLSPTVNYFAHF